MKLEEFIQRKLIEQKDKLKWGYQKEIRRWYVLIDFMLPRNPRSMQDYLNKVFIDKKISLLQDRPLIFAKVYIFGMRLKMKLWVETTVLAEPILAALNVAFDGLEKLRSDKKIFLESYGSVNNLIYRRYMPISDEYLKLLEKEEESK